MVRDAYKFVIPILAVAAAFGWLHSFVPFGLLVLAALFICYFFRNPKRAIPAGENLVVSPADGRIIKIVPIPEEGDASGGQQVSIFLNIFDVHVNRAPVGGELERLEYMRGKFKVAYDEEASKVNEQNVLTIRGAGMQVVVKQIAGLLARRVVCWKKPGDAMQRGELIGLIRFGSRVDLILPRQVKVLVRVGDRVKGGSSVIGERT